MQSIRNLGDILAAEHIPLSERPIAHSMYQLLKSSAASFGDLVALKYLEDPDYLAGLSQVTYTQLLERVTKFANLFHEATTGNEVVVSHALPNLPETHYVLWGAQTAGIVNPVNPFLEVDAMAAIFKAAKTNILVCAGPSLDRDAWAKMVEVLPDVPTIEAVFVLETSAMVVPPAGLAIPVFNLLAESARQDEQKLKFSTDFSSERVVAYFCTGGTTGTPKLARLTNGNITYVSWVLSHLLSGGQEDVYFCGLPLFHVNAVIVTGALPFATGGCVMLLSREGFRNKRVIARFWDLVQAFRPTTFSAVPTVYAALLQNFDKEYQPTSLKFAICGAAPLSAELKSRFQRKTSIQIVEGYGLTEGTCVSTINLSDNPDSSGSVGVRIPYQGVRVVELDDSGVPTKECGSGKPGVLLIKGPNVFPGYVADSDNVGIFTEDGWFITGDMATVNEDGFVSLCGRSKDVIIRGGHNIDPQVIEEALACCPGVTAVAAVGAPDAYAGEIPVAFVQLDAGTAATAEDIRVYAKKAIPERAAAPVHIFVVEQLPTTQVGKIFKPALREQAAEEIVSQMLSSQGLLAEVRAYAGSDYRHGMKIVVKVGGQQEAVHDFLSALPLQIEIKVQEPC